jgi:hypothetical protein
MPDYHAIYLIQEREFAGTNTYKIGRTCQHGLKRYMQYPKDSRLVLQIQCDDSVNCERELLHILKGKFVQRTDIGSESFDGDESVMMDIIFNYISNHKPKKHTELIEDADAGDLGETEKTDGVHSVTSTETLNNSGTTENDVKESKRTGEVEVPKHKRRIIDHATIMLWLSQTPLHLAIADGIYQTCKDDYKYADKHWFQREGDQWLKTVDDSPEYLICDFYRSIEQMKCQYFLDATKTQVQDKKIQLILKGHSLVKVMDLFRDIAFREKMIKRLASNFTEHAR